MLLLRLVHTAIHSRQLAIVNDPSLFLCTPSLLSHYPFFMYFTYISCSKHYITSSPFRVRYNHRPLPNIARCSHWDFKLQRFSTNNVVATCRLRCFLTHCSLLLYPSSRLPALMHWRSLGRPAIQPYPLIPSSTSSMMAFQSHHPLLRECYCISQLSMIRGTKMTLMTTATNTVMN